MKSFPDMVRPPSHANPRSRRVAMLFEERRMNRRSILAGIIGTILFHLLFIFGVPPSYFALQLAPVDSPTHDLDLELVTDEEMAEPDEPRFVETNPEAPENIPDDTSNFAARSQQAANEEVPDELSPDRTPARQGEDELPFDKLISGELNPEIQITPSPETPESSEQAAASTPTRQAPLPGFEQDEDESEEGTGMSVADASARPMPVLRQSEGQDAETDATLPPAFSSEFNQERPAPAPRPRLPRAPPGPVKRQPAGVSQTGRLAVDAKFSEYGEYLERMIEAVTQRWHALCSSRSYSERTTHVVLEFKLTKDGEIRNLETVDTSAQALGVLLCRSAVEGGQPYGPWTKEMVDVLGDEQTITFHFYYW